MSVSPIISNSTFNQLHKLPVAYHYGLGYIFTFCIEKSEIGWLIGNEGAFRMEIDIDKMTHIRIPPRLFSTTSIEASFSTACLITIRHSALPDEESIF